MRLRMSCREKEVQKVKLTIRREDVNLDRFELGATTAMGGAGGAK